MSLLLVSQICVLRYCNFLFQAEYALSPGLTALNISHVHSTFHSFAASATVRAVGSTASWCSLMGMTKDLGAKPRIGLVPTRLLVLDGLRILPSVSVPRANSQFHYHLHIYRSFYHDSSSPFSILLSMKRNFGILWTKWFWPSVFQREMFDWRTALDPFPISMIC